MALKAKYDVLDYPNTSAQSPLYPYTLLGAICYATGRYDEGHRWFEEARKRGATEKDEDTEIKRILQKTKDKKKLQEFIDYLLNKDSHRYYWVKKSTVSRFKML